MPATESHIQRAQENEAFNREFSLESTPYLHWAVTTLFYSALHWVDVILHEHRTRANPRGIHPESHVERTSAVAASFPRIYREYRSLKDASEDARYRLIPFTPGDVRHYADHEFAAIRSFARSSFRSP